MNGYLDDVRIYNRALTQAEIQALVQQPNKKIFVTASTYTGDLRTGGVGTGIVGADAKCNSDSNKPGTGNYKDMLVDGVWDGSTFSNITRRAYTISGEREVIRCIASSNKKI